MEAPRGSAAKFPVHAVEPEARRLPPIGDDHLRRAFSALGGGSRRLEGCSKLDVDVPAVGTFECPNLLASAVHTAFYKHYPLKLNPNILWLTIAQGFGTYVNDNAELLRHKFVAHEGKKTLTLLLPQFVFHGDNDWTVVFPAFAEQIAAHVGGEAAALVEADFSNTSANDRLASQIVLMDSMQKYFNYALMCGCGIPYIELLGLPEDWRRLRAKAAALGGFVPSPEEIAAHEAAKPKAAGGEEEPSDSYFGFGRGRGACRRRPGEPGSPLVLETWLAELLPVLDKFVEAAEGRPDVPFFGSVCNMVGASGIRGDPITGWIQVLFPYAASGSPNRSVTHWRAAYAKALASRSGRPIAETADGGMLAMEPPARGCGDGGRFGDGGHGWGMKLEDFPQGLAKAPVKATYLDVQPPMQQELTVYGGLVALHQHPEDGALEVRSGWAVVEESAAPAPVG